MGLMNRVLSTQSSLLQRAKALRTQADEHEDRQETPPAEKKKRSTRFSTPR
jgi:hypothetical protein